MIQRLREDGRRFGEPEYSAAGRAIETSGAALRQRLSTEELGWLEQMEDAYLRRERAVMDGAFRSGFCRAVLLALEVLEYRICSEKGEGQEGDTHA